ncbi:universal stress protein [Desulfocicer niacini]
MILIDSPLKLPRLSGRTDIENFSEMNADLIVMGTHEKGVSHTFLGTVAKRVLQRSRTPALIVPLSKKWG